MVSTLIDWWGLKLRLTISLTQIALGSSKTATFQLFSKLMGLFHWDLAQTIRDGCKLKEIGRGGDSRIDHSYVKLSRHLSGQCVFVIVPHFGGSICTLSLLCLVGYFPEHIWPIWIQSMYIQSMYFSEIFRTVAFVSHSIVTHLLNACVLEILILININSKQLFLILP